MAGYDRCCYLYGNYRPWFYACFIRRYAAFKDHKGQLAACVVSGQVTGDTSKLLSDRIGKIMQDRQSLSINSQDTSISKSKQLEAAVPASKISALSSGEFVGTVADDPDNKIALKAFHCEIINDHEVINAEIKNYKPIPIIRQVDNSMVQRNYLQIKQEVFDIVESEKERMAGDPELEGLIVNKK